MNSLSHRSGQVAGKVEPAENQVGIQFILGIDERLTVMHPRAEPLGRVFLQRGADLSPGHGQHQYAVVFAVEAVDILHGNRPRLDRIAAGDRHIGDGQIRVQVIGSRLFHHGFLPVFIRQLRNAQGGHLDAGLGDQIHGIRLPGIKVLLPVPFARGGGHGLFHVFLRHLRIGLDQRPQSFVHRIPGRVQVGGR